MARLVDILGVQHLTGIVVHHDRRIWRMIVPAMNDPFVHLCGTMRLARGTSFRRIPAESGYGQRR
jgi:hypothetical protein